MKIQGCPKADTDIKALRHPCTRLHVNGMIHSLNCAPSGDTYARNSIRGIWAKGQVIIRIEKRMISLLCEAICSVKGTMFCLGNDEKVNIRVPLRKRVEKGRDEL
jgi:hypothetical protein